MHGPCLHLNTHSNMFLFTRWFHLNERPRFFYLWLSNFPKIYKKGAFQSRNWKPIFFLMAIINKIKLTSLYIAKFFDHFYFFRFPSSKDKYRKRKTKKVNVKISSQKNTKKKLMKSMPNHSVQYKIDTQTRRNDSRFSCPVTLHSTQQLKTYRAALYIEFYTVFNLKCRDK